MKIISNLLKANGLRKDQFCARYVLHQHLFNTILLRWLTRSIHSKLGLPHTYIFRTEWQLSRPGALPHNHILFKNNKPNAENVLEVSCDVKRWAKLVNDDTDLK